MGFSISKEDRIDIKTATDMKKYAEKSGIVFPTNMYFSVKFNRPYDSENMYVSPGGYCVNGKEFDFINTYCDYEDGCNVVDFEVAGFDFEYAVENNGVPTMEDFVKNNWSEFFIYTGELGEDEEVNPISVENLKISFSNGHSLSVDEQTLQEISSLFAENRVCMIDKFIKNIAEQVGVNDVNLKDYVNIVEDKIVNGMNIEDASFEAFQEVQASLSTENEMELE